MNTYDKPHYLAGPMSGIPAFNYPAFDEAAAELRKMGYKITSPAEMDDPEVAKVALESPLGELGDGMVVNGECHTWGDFLSRDVKLLADECGGIILLPGWEKSKGARLECFVAIQCGYDCYFWFPEYKILSLTTHRMAMLMMNEEIIRAPIKEYKTDYGEVSAMELLASGELDELLMSDEYHSEGDKV